MARRGADNHKPIFSHGTLVPLVEVALVALALGVAVGSGAQMLAIVLTGALVGTLGSCALFLARRGKVAGSPIENAVAIASTPAEDVPAVANRTVATDDKPEVDITPSVTSLDEWDMGVNPPSSLDLAALSERIVGVADPIAELKLFVGDIRTREAEGTDAPSPFERFAARMLVEAGLFKEDVKLPRIRIVRPPASGMFYLRITDQRLPYRAKIRVLSLEAALNALRFSDTYFDDPDAHEVEEHFQLLQKLTHSIAAQAPSLADHIPITDDESPDTEWAVRMAISTAIESFQLPHRLSASWRVNVADGNVAFEIELPPEATFPATRFVEDLGLVATSREMRRKAASDYALRLALLVANAAFRCSELIKHVWVAGSVQTATRHACYLSVDFDRWRFSHLDLSDLGDLSSVYHSFAPAMRLEEGILRPVEQTFDLGERRFCPPRRYEPVSLSTRKIARPWSESLGTERVSGLAIDEGSGRELMAADIMSKLGDTTEHNVHLIMELAGDAPDPTVRTAAERTVNKLIAGTLEEDAQAIGREFLAGDPLSLAVQRAGELLSQKAPSEAQRVIEEVLAPIDDAGLYADTPNIEYRFFPSYVERALYNRLFAYAGRLPSLVPQTYFQAHYLMSVSLLMQGSLEGALTHARRLVELAPLDARTHAHLTRCLELLGRDDEAVDVLTHLLTIAHDPEGLALAYYRMAFFQWKQGHTLAAQACYATSLRFAPAYTPYVAMEMATLAYQNPGSFREELSEQEAEQLLKDQGIPVAPTEEMSEAFLDCARASLDAEIFPVARNFAWILGAFSQDDIVAGLIRSIEDAPSERDQ
ncbi:MAG: tetratricopeptide repeat protein [Atopobiaceae bacterium]|nr:tetratricopeptide repeat protein [Atopobiaceae bacterium]